MNLTRSARLLEEDNDQENALEGLDSRNIIQGKRTRHKAWPISFSSWAGKENSLELFETNARASKVRIMPIW